MIAEHANYAVAQVDRKTGKHAPHLGLQRHERFHNERVRRLLRWFGRMRHGPYRLTGKTLTVLDLTGAKWRSHELSMIAKGVRSVTTGRRDLIGTLSQGFTPGYFHGLPPGGNAGFWRNTAAE